MQNLWAEFDNELMPSESTGRAQKPESPRQSRPSEQAVLSSLREWLLQDYVASFCRALAATRIYRRCYWIDALGFHLRTKTQIDKTSPLLQSIVSLAQVLAQESKPIAFQSMLLEAGSSKRNAVKTTIEDNSTSSLPNESGIVHASWLEVAPAALEVIDQSPAIFLLNPFGLTTFTYDDLAPLYQRTAPTELFLFISHKQLETRLLPALHTPAGASELTDLVRSDRWKSLLTNGEEAERVIDGMIDLFLASMQSHFLAVERIAFPMQVRPRVVEIAPCTLLFATRRKDSLITMNDALCDYRRRLYEQSSRGALVEEWFVKRQQERHAEKMQQLYQRTLQQGCAQRTRRWPDLRQQLLIANFGQFTLNDYNEVLRRLIHNGEVRCEWRHGPPDNLKDRAIPIAGNEDTLFWK